MNFMTMFIIGEVANVRKGHQCSVMLPLRLHQTEPIKPLGVKKLQSGNGKQTDVSCGIEEFGPPESGPRVMQVTDSNITIHEPTPRFDGVTRYSLLHKELIYVHFAEICFRFKGC